jgi:uncharacterized tellurite resistance protein B-like protein
MISIILEKESLVLEMVSRILTTLVSVMPNIEKEEQKLLRQLLTTNFKIMKYQLLNILKLRNRYGSTATHNLLNFIKLMLVMNLTGQLISSRNMLV